MLAREGEYEHRVELTIVRWEGIILTTKNIYGSMMIGFLSLAAFLWQERYKSLAFSEFLVLEGKNDTFAGNANRRRPRVLGKFGSEPNPSCFIYFWIR
jgi:hypothetical protein